jgi:hypothetical protein
MSTTVVYGDAVEGTNTGNNAVYATARSVQTDNSVALFIGQYGTYVVNEAFLRFNTSFLGTDTIVSAVLSLYVENNASVTDFVLEARLHDWGITLEAADWVAGDDIASKILLASIDTSTVTQGAYNDLTDVALPANINKTGFTNFLLNSSRQRLANAPTTDEYVAVTNKADGGASTGPKLTIVHSAIVSSYRRSGC